MIRFEPCKTCGEIVQYTRRNNKSEWQIMQEDGMRYHECSSTKSP